MFSSRTNKAVAVDDVEAVDKGSTSSAFVLSSPTLTGPSSDVRLANDKSAKQRKCGILLSLGV